MSSQLPVVIALDRMELASAQGLVLRLEGRVYAVKIHHLWDKHGSAAVRALKDAGAARVWVDLKLHDTSDTVADRAKVVAEAGAGILTVHASGEVDMMMAAVKTGPSCVFAITALTSLTEEQTHLLHGQPAKAAVLYLARLAKLAGVHGVVCSPHETNTLFRRTEFAGLTIVNPGIRLSGQAAGQQARFDTPEFAISQGAGLLVLGSAITKAEDPLATLDLVEQGIAAGYEGRAGC